MKGKYCCPRGPTLSSNIPKTVSYKISIMYCHFEGRIRKLESGPHNIENSVAKKKMPKQIMIVAFEIEKSNDPRRKAQTGII